MVEAVDWLIMGLFAASYVVIAFENKLVVDKSAIALVTGVVLWVLVAVLQPGDDAHLLEEMGSEIFSIFIFLLAAMALVEVLVLHRFFDLIQSWLAGRKLTDRPQFVIVMVMTFFLSAVLDNLTVTIVMVNVSLRFFSGRNRLITVAGVVILANAGGAWSPIGDVTTILLWLDGKFTAGQVILQGFLPAAVIGTIATLLLVRKLDDDTADQPSAPVRLNAKEVVVNALVLSSFGLSLVANLLGLPPYMGLLLGLGVAWLLMHHLEHREAGQDGGTALGASISHVFRQVDVPALMFFVGILMAVSALGAAGILETLSTALLGEDQDFTRAALGSVGLGLLSAVVDNVPLTALSLDLIQISDPDLWVLVALAVGTGGSALVIGSAAGVVAMALERRLTFGAYLRIATVPALVAYFAGVLTWWLQRAVL